MSNGAGQRGDLPTGPDAGGKPDADGGSPDTAAEPYPCPNCGAVVTGRYCPDCGQRKDLRPLSVMSLFWDLLVEILDSDARVWRTLRTLILRPGRLTREWINGRRAAYMPPFRLYLVLNLLAFVLLSIQGGVEFDDAWQSSDAPRMAVERQLEALEGREDEQAGRRRQLLRSALEDLREEEALADRAAALRAATGNEVRAERAAEMEQRIAELEASGDPADAREARILRQVAASLRGEAGPADVLGATVDAMKEERAATGATAQRADATPMPQPAGQPDQQEASDAPAAAIEDLPDGVPNGVPNGMPEDVPTAEDFADVEDDNSIDFDANGERWTVQLGPLDDWLVELGYPQERLDATAQRIADDPGRALEDLFERLPMVMILLLPFIATLMRVLYLFGRPWVSHLVGLVHLHSFVFLLILLTDGFGGFGLLLHTLGAPVGETALGNTSMVLASLVLPIYLVRWLQVLYGHGLFMAGVMSFVLLLAHFIGAVLGIVMLVVGTFAVEVIFSG